MGLSEWDILLTEGAYVLDQANPILGEASLSAFLTGEGFQYCSLRRSFGLEAGSFQVLWRIDVLTGPVFVGVTCMHQEDSLGNAGFYAVGLTGTDALTEARIYKYSAAQEPPVLLAQTPLASSLTEGDTFVIKTQWHTTNDTWYCSVFYEKNPSLLDLTFPSLSLILDEEDAASPLLLSSGEGLFAWTDEDSSGLPVLRIQNDHIVIRRRYGVTIL